jgi:hypothetical protein
MDERESRTFYLSEGLAVAERVLGLGDREVRSATHGCFDRYYWHYRLLDFPNARAQEMGYYLALLYVRQFAGNRYAGVSAIRRWAEAAVSFWYQIQNRDGSFNEWWPHERSFCATSFSALAAAETIRLLGLSPNRDVFQRATNWLCRHNNPEVSNQVAASALALRCVSEVCGDEILAKKAEERVLGVVRRQHSEGFFPEYGGSDAGYHSLTVSLLAAYYRRAPSEPVLAALRNATAFLDRHLREDASFDYRSGSRRTQFLYPSGLVRLGEDGLVARHLAGCRAGTVLLPSWMDDRYCFQLATDYLVAGLPE